MSLNPARLRSPYNRAATTRDTRLSPRATQQPCHLPHDVPTNHSTCLCVCVKGRERGRRGGQKERTVQPPRIPSSGSTEFSFASTRSLSSRLFTLQTRQRARARSLSILPFAHCQNKWSPSSEVASTLALPLENQNRPQKLVFPARWKNVLHGARVCRHLCSCRACCFRSLQAGIYRRSNSFTRKYSFS